MEEVRCGVRPEREGAIRNDVEVKTKGRMPRCKRKNRDTSDEDARVGRQKNKGD